MATFLSMTNTDLEEVGITDAEEKLNILDAIVEIKVSKLLQLKLFVLSTYALHRTGCLHH